ncbi:hypothetical protein F1C16_04650 [Hymenobacter sp. NBH84]|uniref:hypothetical protein n=1 Tax=Hymenobacter sp. NBH84 TaxID=2596915 RepID=UPI00162A542E|nr:hypothetical protein [Hymenobacter sp. NBH84]QNE38896.1 hypothetical protein F1C16_04650 [Hymenobacter sp. NBH84]
MQRFQAIPSLLSIHPLIVLCDMIKAYHFAGSILLLLPVAATAQLTPSYQQTAPLVKSSALAPKPSYLRLGVGTAYDVNGYYRCTRLALEYAPTLSQHFGAAGRIVGVFGNPSDKLQRQLPNQNYKAGFIEAEGVYYPFGTDKRVLFGVGAGGFAGYYEKNDYNYLKATSGQVTDYLLVSYRGPYAGVLFSLNLDAAVGARQLYRVGAKATVQNGINGGRTSTYNLTLARRL